MKPELAVRKLVHSMGYRYRLHRHDLPGRPDMVFSGRRKIIFVHGCFWHQHPDPRCKRAHTPRSNQDYWQPKLEKNVRRDSEHIQTLTEAGWAVLVLWECEVAKDLNLASRIRAFLA
jgi:DNA mismatch endonuclease (patch repair protein)